MPNMWEQSSNGKFEGIKWERDPSKYFHLYLMIYLILPTT